MTLRQEHRPGAGAAGRLRGRHGGGDGRRRSARAQIFVKPALPFSGLIYAEATWTQRVEDWLSSHVRAFNYIGGVAAAGARQPEERRHQGELLRPGAQRQLLRAGPPLRHRRPAGSTRKPRDKPAVENAVLQVERWILAPLRHRTFFGLDELNAAIAPLREALNNRPLSPPREGTRQSVFEAEERTLLRPLPAEPYVVGQWELCRAVGADYHVVVDGHYYSVPSALAHTRVDVFTTPTLVSIFQRGERVASHRTARSRADTRRGLSTCRQAIAPSWSARPSACAPRRRRSAWPRRPTSTV